MNSLRFSSWCLCRLLDIIVDTKENVTINRKRDAMYDYVEDLNMLYAMLYSGSRGEGFNFLSSDADIMYVDRNTVVLESIYNAQLVNNSKTFLLMIRERCNPGFVILRLLGTTSDCYIRASIVEYHGHPVVSSLLHRDKHRLTYQRGHGPCNTYTVESDVDIAHCFECKKWPSEADEFKYRKRPNGWPQKSLLDKIISRGCHLVPVGDKNTDLSYIQWRLSFSAAEKDLVHSFNHTQFLVYGLLKIFLKQVITKYHSVPDDILCSYFLKTAMFYSIEGTSSVFWRDDLLIPCFWLCLNKLVYWVEQGYCPNYFVPQNNMFRGKVFGENQDNLLTVLNQCKRFGWKCICLCQDLQSLKYFINHPMSLYTNRIILNEKQRESSSDIIVYHALSRPLILSQEEMQKRLTRILTSLCYSRTQKEEDISTMLLYNVLRSIGQINACVDVGIKNKQKYRKLYHMLLASVKSNIITGCLYLGTFYYNTRQYRKTVHLCNRVIAQLKPYIMYDSMEHRKVFYTNDYWRYLCGRGINILDKAKLAYSTDVYIFYSTKDFCPAELRHDIEARAPFYLWLPPIPYTLFLLFLCHHKLGNIDDSVTALHDLQLLINDREQGCSGYPIVLNMLAVCQEKIGDVHSAIDTCLLSQNLKPEKNGAENMLANFLRKYS